MVRLVRLDKLYELDQVSYDSYLSMLRWGQYVYFKYECPDETERGFSESKYQI